jgi:hypothetical protein
LDEYTPATHLGPKRHPRFPLHPLPIKDEVNFKVEADVSRACANVPADIAGLVAADSANPLSAFRIF